MTREEKLKFWQEAYVAVIRAKGRESFICDINPSAKSVADQALFDLETKKSSVHND